MLQDTMQVPHSIPFSMTRLLVKDDGGLAFTPDLPAGD